MLKALLDRFTGLFKRPTVVFYPEGDPRTEEPIATIRRWVEPQLADYGAHGIGDLSVGRPVALGYIATLASELTKGYEDPKQGALMVALLSAYRLDAPSGRSHDDLIDEFSRLEKGRDELYGRGGAVALEDFAISRRGGTPRGLYEELKADKTSASEVDPKAKFVADAITGWVASQLQDLGADQGLVQLGARRPFALGYIEALVEEMAEKTCANPKSAAVTIVLIVVGRLNVVVGEPDLAGIGREYMELQGSANEDYRRGGVAGLRDVKDSSSKPHGLYDEMKGLRLVKSPA